MAFNEFDALTDDQLIEAINRLMSDIRQSEYDRSQVIDDRTGETLEYQPADDYMLQDERERLDKLIAEAARRGLPPPADEQALLDADDEGEGL